MNADILRKRNLPVGPGKVTERLEKGACCVKQARRDRQCESMAREQAKRGLVGPACLPIDAIGQGRRSRNGEGLRWFALA